MVAPTADLQCALRTRPEGHQAPAWMTRRSMASSRSTRRRTRRFTLRPAGLSSSAAFLRTRSEEGRVVATESGSQERPELPPVYTGFSVRTVPRRGGQGATGPRKPRAPRSMSNFVRRGGRGPPPLGRPKPRKAWRGTSRPKASRTYRTILIVTESTRSGALRDTSAPRGPRRGPGSRGFRVRGGGRRGRAGSWIVHTAMRSESSATSADERVGPVRFGMFDDTEESS